MFKVFIVFVLLCFTVPNLRAEEELREISHAPSPQSYKHLFTFNTANIEGLSPSDQVYLTGTFNQWSITSHPMINQGNHLYTLELSLPEGVYQYQFYVNKTRYRDVFNDPEIEELDFFGKNNNSAVVIGPDYRKLPPPLRTINRVAIRHDPKDISYTNVVSQSILQISLKAQANDLKIVKVWYKSDNKPEWKQIKCQKIETHLGLDTFFCDFFVKDCKFVNYLLEISNGLSTLYIGQGTFFFSCEAAIQHPYSVEMQPTFTPPDWAKNVIWYQITPKSFRNGDPSNDPLNTLRWQSDINSQLPGDVAKDPSNPYYYVRSIQNRQFGGDLQGVLNSLPYLRSLGVTGIYLNPVLCAHSSHKYDITDFRHIDDDFGVKNSLKEIKGEADDPKTWQWSKTDKLFFKFIQEAHKQGFHVILDIGFHSMSIYSAFFQDVLINGPSSQYVNWFEINNWKKNEGPLSLNRNINYSYWGADPTMALIKTDSDGNLLIKQKAYISEITKRWLAPEGDVTQGIDGFRVDSPSNLVSNFWQEWRLLVKSIKPDSLIIGEEWHDGTKFLKGDQFDGTTHFPIARAFFDFFVKEPNGLTVTQFDKILHLFVENEPLQAAFVEMNLIDNHDVDRFITMFANPSIPFDQHSEAAEYDVAQGKIKYVKRSPLPDEWKRFKQVIALQMSFLGAPMIFYGDEVGMWGSGICSRSPMVWKDLEPFDDPKVRFNQDFFDYYQRLIAIRHSLQPLTEGLFHTVLVNDAKGIYAFKRSFFTSNVYVVLNHQPYAQVIELDVVEKDTPFIDYLNPVNTSVDMTSVEKNLEGRPCIKINPNVKFLHDCNGKLSLSLEPYGSMILKPINDKGFETKAGD